MATKAASLPDISGLTVQQLTQLIADAEEARKGKMQEAKQALLDEMRAKAAELGMSPSDLFGWDSGNAKPAGASRRKRSDAGKGVAAKFRGPNGETWSGRGRMPRWLHEAEKAGKKRAEFAVQ